MLNFYDAFGSAQEMFKFYETHKNKKCNVFDFDWKVRTENSEYQKKLFLCVMAVKSKNESDEKKLRDKADSLFQFFRIKSICRLNEILIHSDDQLMKFIMNVIYQILIAFESNIEHKTKSLVLMGSPEQVLSINNHPALFLLNDACEHNIFIHCDRKKMIWMVNRPIPAGGQIFKSFDVQNEFYGKKEKCRFKDSCAPCKNGWRANFNMQQFQSVFFKRCQEMPNHHGELKPILDVIKKSSDFINKNFKENETDPQKILKIIVEKHMLFNSLSVLVEPFILASAGSLRRQ